MNPNAHALFQVSVKAIVRRNDNTILVLRTATGGIDFPGGRTDSAEARWQLHDILRREIGEEIGTDIEIEIGELAFISKRHFAKQDHTQHVLAVHYEATYRGGDVVLSDEHVSYDWVLPESLFGQGESFISADEYTQFENYYQQEGRA